MCGRFTMSDPERVLREFSVLEKRPLLPRYNVAPSQGIWVLCAIGDEESPTLHEMRWGLPPSHGRGNAPVIMARSETVGAGAFIGSLRDRRCLLLADGFYEWQQRGKTKQPFLFRRSGAAPFAMAGIWQPDTTGALDGRCAVLTRPAVGAMATVHHRMPLVLDAAQHRPWLDPHQHDLSILRSVLTSEPMNDFDAIAVSPRVGSPANDDASCVAPIAESERAGEQGDLWTRATRE